MSAQDPRSELGSVIGRGSNRKLPQKALDWAGQALSTTEGILTTMDDMASNGVDVPTLGQERALRKIYVGACRWLHQEPEEGGLS